VSENDDVTSQAVTESSAWRYVSY